MFVCVIFLDSFVKLVKKYYWQTLLEECKYTVKKIKDVFNEELNIDESDNGYEEFEEENNVYEECIFVF